jgi:PAS domain S-box-containing protein
MKISARLRLAIFIPAMMALAIIVALVISNQDMARTREAGDAVRQIRSSISELNHFVFSYVLYHEERPKQQFLAGCGELTQLIDSARVNTADQQQLLDNVRGDSATMRDLFLQLVSNYENAGTDGTQESLGMEDRLAGLLLLKSYEADVDAASLRSLIDDRIRVKETRTIGLIFLVIVLATIPLTIVLVRTRRGIISSLSNLSKGAAVIGSGKLDFTIEEKGNDEIGELTHAFNRMTTDLKNVTASRTDLEKEVEERKKTEETLHESEERFRALSETSPIGVGLTSDEGVLLYTNPSYEHILGYEHAELIGKKAIDLYLDPKDRLSWVGTMKEKGMARNTETRLKRRDGTPIWVSINASPIVYGGRQAVMGTIQDITERKKAEETLRETRDYLDNLFNYANAPIIVWNPDFEITRFNHAFEHLTGRTADEVMGKKLDILFPDHSREESMDFIRKTPIGERWDVVEIPILHRDGAMRVVLWNSATVYAPDGKTAVATIAQGQDITKRKEAEEDLKRSIAELEASNKELEAFSYSVSHDLRAPLRSMEGFSSALLEDYADKLDEQGKQYLKHVQEASDLMGRLIDDLLKLSRVTRSEMTREEVDLTEMAQKILLELQKNEPNRKVKLDVSRDITAYGDRNLLRLALENLLGNAWKFSSKTDAPKIEMGFTSYDGKRAYFIRDNGVGFDMVYADKLFQPFQRLHKAPEFPGTGIGLATVQRIIRRHGGEVWAESKVGEGATFYFTLG